LSQDRSVASRIQILELELPILGGHLRDSDDAGKRADDDWIEYVADKVAEYRDRAQELRSAIERLDLRSVELSPVERELVASVASVSESLPGITKVGPQPTSATGPPPAAWTMSASSSRAARRNGSTARAAPIWAA
jgi:hypothetical protein